MLSKKFNQNYLLKNQLKKKIYDKKCTKKMLLSTMIHAGFFIPCLLHIYFSDCPIN